MSIEMIAIGIALLFAINIGASGSAASMGIAYGSGAINSKRIALPLAAIGIFLGAYLGGGQVVKTLGSGIIPTTLLSVEIVVIILLSATVSLFAANLMGIPLSTSEVTVGSVIGVGVAFQSLYVQKILTIISFWVVIPIIAFAMAWIGGLCIRRLESRNPKWKGIGSKKWKSILSIFVIGAAFLEAFSAGMNNVANAIGPIVGAGIIQADDGIIMGGIFVGLGAMLLGGKVLETNGKKITSLTLLQGFMISSTGGILVIIASLFGIPVPLTQITTTAILGTGIADQGFRMLNSGIISKIFRVWLVSPLLTLVISFTLVKILISPSMYIIVVLAALIVTVLVLQSLYRTMLKEKREFNEDGSGI